jgi:glycosyltransferase involved in cell wall biosynthesis
MVVRGLRERCPVVVVDDASTDGSGLRARAAGATCVIRHARRLGKAAALRTGFAEALRRGAAHVATLDGDGQHDPADLPRLTAAAAEWPTAVVVGDRFGGRRGPAEDESPPLRWVAIRLADWLVTRLTRTRIRDSQCGYRVYPASALRTVPLREDGFVLETEVLVGAARAGHPLLSVPVRRLYPAGRRGRFHAVADGGRIAGYLLRELRRGTGGRSGPRARAVEGPGRPPGALVPPGARTAGEL